MLGPSPVRGPPTGPPALRFPRPQQQRPRAVDAAYTLTGVTRDSTGVILPNCVVDLFYATGDKQRYGSTVSDASGAYTFLGGDNVSAFFVVCYLAGGTPVSGTSLQTLQFS